MLRQVCHSEREDNDETQYLVQTFEDYVTRAIGQWPEEPVFQATSGIDRRRISGHDDVRDIGCVRW